MPRVLLAIAATFVLANAIACGGGGGSPAPGPSPAPTPSPTPSPTPTSQPTPEPTPAPPVQDGVDLRVERLDPAAECDLLVPDAPQRPVTLAVATPAGSTCLGASGDGTGHAAVGARAGEVTTWTVIAPGGAARGAASGAGLTELIRQGAGWHGLVETPLFSPFEEVELLVLTPAGTVGPRVALTPPTGTLASESRIAGDPAGGSAVASVATLVSGNHGSRVDLSRFDAGGAPVHPPVAIHADPGPMVPFIGAGVSRRGEAIVTYRVPGFLSWTWVARDGTPVATGQVAQVDVGAADPVRLEALLDGGVAVRFGVAWGAVIPHRGTTAAPAPEWLAARPGSVLRFTRGNRGYALLPGPGEQVADCSRTVDLIAPSGRLCGRITTREGAGSCTAGAVEHGWDGTLVVQSARDTCSGAGCTCTVYAWPGLLAPP